MAQNDLLKRYLDAGLAFTALTQSRAEALVKDLVKVGEVQADQARDVVVDLLERSRRNSERFLEAVATEVKAQITNLGLASQDDLDKLEKRLAALFGAAAPAKRAGSQPAPAEKAPAKKKAAAKKAPAKKKAAAKKAPVTRKAAAKKAPAKRTPPQAAPAQDAPAAGAAPTIAPTPAVGEPSAEG